MLIGYDDLGNIKFIFTDDAYLKTKFPNNTAKVSTFWGSSGKDLHELFIEGTIDIHNMKVIDGKLVKQEPVKDNPIEAITYFKRRSSSSLSSKSLNVSSSSSSSSSNSYEKTDQR